jgi:hypothetical protein
MVLTIVWASEGSCERQLEQHQSTGSQHKDPAKPSVLLL